MTEKPIWDFRLETLGVDDSETVFRKTSIIWNLQGVRPPKWLWYSDIPNTCDIVSEHFSIIIVTVIFLMMINCITQFQFLTKNVLKTNYS